MTDFDVGKRLKQLREANHLSQRQLAERAMVPHGMISMIETNRNSPSVSSLRKILEGMNTSMSEFFEPEQADSTAVFFRSGEFTDLTSLLYGANRNKGSIIRLQQIGDAKAANLQILHEYYEPGADTGETMLEHKAHEGGFVISGEIEVSVGDQKTVLRSGDGYLFDSTHPHRFRNLGSEPCIVISACTPPYL